MQADLVVFIAYSGTSRYNIDKADLKLFNKKNER